MAKLKKPTYVVSFEFTPDPFDGYTSKLIKGDVTYQFAGAKKVKVEKVDG